MGRRKAQVEKQHGGSGGGGGLPWGVGVGIGEAVAPGGRRKEHTTVKHTGTFDHDSPEMADASYVYKLHPGAWRGRAEEGCSGL